MKRGKKKTQIQQRKETERTSPISEPDLLAQLQERVDANIRGNPTGITVTNRIDFLETREVPETFHAALVPETTLPQWLDRIESPTPLNLMWAWFVGYAAQEVRNSTEGKPVDSPLAPFSSLTSLAANWWKYLSVIVLAFLVVYFLL